MLKLACGLSRFLVESEYELYLGGSPYLSRPFPSSDVGRVPLFRAYLGLYSDSAELFMKRLGDSNLKRSVDLSLISPDFDPFLGKSSSSIVDPVFAELLFPFSELTVTFPFLFALLFLYFCAFPCFEEAIVWCWLLQSLIGYRLIPFVGLVDPCFLAKIFIETSSKVPEGMSDWLDSLVLMCVSVVNSEYCVQLRKHRRICSSRDQEKNYELVAPDPDKRKASWVSFRSAQGKKVFAMYDESFRDFKNYYFKVRAVEGARPFFLEANNEHAFLLCWQKNVVISRYSWEMLDEVEQVFVNVLEENWGQPPHLDTKRFLGDPSLLRAELEMLKNADSMKAFKKARKATAAQNISVRAAGEGSSQVPPKKLTSGGPGLRKVIPTPQVYLVDPPRSTSGATSSPTAGPPPKRQKAVEPFDLDAPDFDDVGFVNHQIASYGVIPMDDVSILRHLDFITRNSVKMAHMGAALFRTAQDVLVYATKAFIEEAKSEYDRIKVLKEELDVKVAKLEKDLENEKARATAAVASATLAEEMAQKQKESYICTYGNLLEARERLESVQADYTELQGHLMGSVTTAYENLKAQVRVLAPELDLALFSLDNFVENGKIVPAPNEDDDDVNPPPAPSAKASVAPTSPTPAAEVGHPESDTDVQILNRTDGTVDDVPLVTHPPSPRDATTRESLNPL
ncbi:uncharacterized protein DS421_2g50410 [Arachis hypogaea]|nr:uncharacterized protein DS421_2g50410 [Arachis hypogaea]